MDSKIPTCRSIMWVSAVRILNQEYNRNYCRENSQYSQPKASDILLGVVLDDRTGVIDADEEDVGVIDDCDVLDG